jgi:hypothetical protein
MKVQVYQVFSCSSLVDGRDVTSDSYRIISTITWQKVLEKLIEDYLIINAARKYS